MKRNVYFVRNKLVYLIVGLFIFFAYFLSSIITLKDSGVFWDEPAYYSSAESYLTWFKKPSFGTIDKYWVRSELHPPLEKIAQAVSLEILHNRLGMVDKITAFKFPNLFFAAILVLSVYLLALKYFGFKVALASSLFLTVMPRFFGHAHFATMEIPLTLFVFLAAWAFWENRDKNLVLPGVLLGLALLTKMTGLLFVIPLALFLVARTFLRRRNLFESFVNLIIFMIAIFVPFLVFWPKLWLDPIGRLIEFFSFYSTNKVAFMYFGEIYFRPPWHFPWVMLLITTPIPILLLSILGILSILRQREKRELKIFLLLNFLFLPILLSLPNVGAYDAERLLLPSFPFMAVLSGLGVNYLTSVLRVCFKTYCSSPSTALGINLSRTSRLPACWRVARRISYFIICLVFLSGLSYLSHYYPFELSSYNLLVGGIRGAEKIGMEPQYSLESYKGVLPYINENCPQKCTIYAFSNSGPLFSYQEDGYLRKDIIITPNYPKMLPETKFVILPMRKSFFIMLPWGQELYRKVKPIFSYQIDGVSLVNVYGIEDVKASIGNLDIFY